MNDIPPNGVIMANIFHPFAEDKKERLYTNKLPENRAIPTRKKRPVNRFTEKDTGNKVVIIKAKL